MNMTALQQQGKFTGWVAGSVLALALVAPNAPAAEEQVATVGRSAPPIEHAGFSRQPQLILTIEIQGGGDKLADASASICSTDNRDTETCYTERNSLYAGDGLGFGIGVLFPFGRSKVDMEIVAGALEGNLTQPRAEYGDEDAGKSFRYFTRALAMVNMEAGMRMGGGLISHFGARYKLDGQGAARRFDSALGARYQMEWDIDEDLTSMGFYVQVMQYDESENGVSGVDADVIGFVTTFRF